MSAPGRHVAGALGQHTLRGTFADRDVPRQRCIVGDGNHGGLKHYIDGRALSRQQLRQRQAVRGRHGRIDGLGQH